VAAAAVLCFKALACGENHQEKMRIFGCDLGLDTDFMKEVRQQTDDKGEFNLLTEYLKLDTSPAIVLNCPPEFKKAPFTTLLPEEAIEALAECCSLNIDIKQALV